jgi:biopolymer transport protein TolR
MAMTVGGNGRTKADMNVTPMIDVLLVLIIIFMVITPIPPRGFDALVPQPSAEGGEQPEALVVTVRADHTTLLNRQPLSLEALRDRLEQLCKLAPSRVIFVRGEAGIEFARVAEVIDLARGLGINHVALMTE